MIYPILFLLLGLILLFLGGEGLVRGSAALALRLGLTPLLVGLTVVAMGTSAPELVVSVRASLAGEGSIAVGNVIGSNILNLGLILGLTALICPLKVQLQILRIDAPILIAVSLLGAWMLSDGAVGRAEGAVLVVGLAGYLLFTIKHAGKVSPPPEVEAEFAESVPKPKGSIWRDLLFVLIGLVLLVAGSRFMVDGAVALAQKFGISDAIIGLTVVALGTSMPELVTCLVAAFKKEPDIALGNIIGSCIFNLLGILGVSAITAPLTAPGISTLDLVLAAGLPVLLLPILRSGSKLERWEGGLLLAAYVAYIGFLWPK